jgi:hypothetical protein
MMLFRNRPPASSLLLGAVLLTIPFAGCDKDEPAQAPILDPSHQGWKNPWCGQCHTLPIAGHDTSDHWACAGCHGGNGACNPNGTGISRTHADTDDCTSCHGQQHQYTAASQCASCHFTSVGGVVDCGGSTGQDGGIPPTDAGTTDGGAPILPDELVSNCYDWPAVEFTQQTSAQMGLYTSGGMAIDFTLREVDGTPRTLSELLATRPVLMVLGAFT